MKEQIKNIIESYCEGTYHLEFNIADLDKMADEILALQWQQTAVMQSVFYSIVDNGTVFEKFKEKETAEYALEEYKRMGFPYATILEIVA